MAKFCTNCGSPLNGTPKFCPFCGTPVLAAHPAPPAQQAPAPQPAVPSPPQAAAPPAPPPPAMRTPPPPAMQAPPPAPAQPAAYSAPVPPMPQAPPNAYNPQFQQNVPPSFAYGNEPYIPDEGIAAMFFRYDNRLNRKRYILRGLVLVGIYIAVAMVAGLLGMLIDQEVASLLIMLVGLAIMVPSYMLLIRRLHDLDRPGWWSIGALIPAVNFALAIYALCCQGTVGPNQYGPDPLQ
ncbi:DUF805 domain-containing protein [Selenomonas ruminantium]|uniref:DUF805 domain-containing protein n=1 Tax=Selenomonas ruminantium TaxID=971 RepID=UPI0015691F5A|nr:DUF805 domain-containing protein [Selenomonas ruminantium]